MEKYFQLIGDLEQYLCPLTVSGYFQDDYGDACQITHSNTLPHPKDGGITYAIDTKPGQSGASVYIKTKENAQLIGIHKAYNTRDKLNTAVFITAELISLLKQWASKMN